MPCLSVKFPSEHKERSPIFPLLSGYLSCHPVQRRYCWWRPADAREVVTHEVQFVSVSLGKLVLPVLKANNSFIFQDPILLKICSTTVL